MTPILRSGAALALVLLVSGCGGSGGGSDESQVTVVTVSCAPAFVQKLGSSHCSATVEGEPAEPNSIEWSANAGSINSSGLFVAPANAGSVTVTAHHTPTAGTGTLNVVISGARSLIDMPDDTTGHQVHALYVVASDGEDRELDTDGTIALSVEAWNEWFADKTGGSRLRLDRFGGALDVSFVRLAHTNEDLNDYGPNVRDRIEYELVARGFDAPDKTYLVYYDGGDAETGSCGGAAYPPELPGSVAALYLQAIPASGPPCSENPFAADVNSPGYMEFAALHEVLHVLGFVPSCAVSYSSAGHVVVDRTDIMYAGSEAWAPAVVDLSRNDYFEAGIANCIDLADSAFLEPAPILSQAPPGWPYAKLDAQSCELEQGLTSTPGVATRIQFINATDVSINVYRLDEVGNRDIRSQLLPYEGYLEATETTHPYVVTTNTNVCLGIYFGTPNFGRAVATNP